MSISKSARIARIAGRIAGKTVKHTVAATRAAAPHVGFAAGCTVRAAALAAQATIDAGVSAYAARRDFVDGYKDATMEITDNGEVYYIIDIATGKIVGSYVKK